MSNPKVEEVTWYQFTVTKGMTECIRCMIGETSMTERVFRYGISEEDSRRFTDLYKKLGVIDET